MKNSYVVRVDIIVEATHDGRANNIVSNIIANVVGATEGTTVINSFEITSVEQLAND